MASIFSSLSFRQRSFSSLSLFFSIIFPSIVLSASLTLDAVEENTSAATFGDFVFENGLIVRVTEEGDLVIGSDGSEGGRETTELYIDATTANNDYDSDKNGSTTTMAVGEQGAGQHHHARSPGQGRLDGCDRNKALDMTNF